MKKEPERIASIAKELGLDGESVGGRVGFNRAQGGKTASFDKDFLKRKLENEINALYDRLAQALKAENARLREELAQLKKDK